PCGSLPGFETIGVEPGTRALRMRVTDLRWEIEEDVLWLEFRLRKGSYATAVLRELVRLT
ncbi:MAG: tRNA pseudouridine(13) synthase TruD, partial [Gammaproteobacteria bacterium]|nr:tRNA pseudouridine(13) synthase TruD [Gammaproteobacteria bacterium]